MDILTGTLEREAGRVWYRVGAARFEIPESVVPTHDGALDLGVRPEHVLLGAAGQPVTVTVIQPLGPVTYVTVGWEGGRLTSRFPGISHVKPGETIHVLLAPEGILFFDRESDRRIAVATA
jgi:multiple sugar transport system ATP-binding protein